VNVITKAVFGVLIAGALACLAVIVFMPRDVRATEYVSPCQDAEAARSRLEAGDASHFDWRELETMHADKIMFFEFRGFVMFVLTRKGCVVSPPGILDYAKDRGEPA
jgi:hypothetical protein